jgi:hypothetical protein
MVGETRRRHGSDILCASVVLLASCLILCAALACSKTVPGEADVGTPSGDSTAAQAWGSAAPAVAWIDSNALPLNDSEHWPDLASLAQPLTDGAFEIQSLCHVAPDTTLSEEAESARARIDRGANAWSLQQQILHYAGDPWTMGQRAWALFNSLVETVMNCESSAPGAQVGITTDESHCDNFSGPCSQFAATIAVPLNQVIAHVYLSSVGSSVTELSLNPWIRLVF